ncbi:MAG: sulfatase [Planctomycetes bacterium]|nr:sulfatase [Planctomycetota bacterium]
MAHTSTRCFSPALLLAASLLCSCSGEAAAPEVTPTQQTAATETAQASADSPNVILFLVDTLRADHVSIYGYDKATTPNIDAFAKTSAVFRRAWANAPKTSPSHASLFSSTYPRVHGVWNRMILPSGEAIFPSLAKQNITMAEAFELAGYRTGAIADGGNVTDGRGFDQGFQTWDSRWRGAENRVDTAIDWLEDSRKIGDPFFLFLHTYQVHTPYLPDPEFVAEFADPNYKGPLKKAYEDAYAFYQNAESDTEFQKRAPGKSQIRTIQQRFYRDYIPQEGRPSDADLAYLIALYDAEIRMVDREFARLLTYLERAGLDKNTVVVVTSDHGEEFWEHGEYGHHQAYDATLHVPLIIHAPGQTEGFPRQENVQLFDVMPTLLDYCGVDVPDTVQGHVLDFTIGAHPLGDPYECIAEANWPVQQLSYRQGRRKAMLFPDSNRDAEVYLLATDKGEQNNALHHDNQMMAAASKKFLRRVQDALTSWDEGCQTLIKKFDLAPGIRNLNALSPEVKAELSELGYGEGLDE